MNQFEIDINLKLERKAALNKNYLSFEIAKETIQTLFLKNVKEFQALNNQRPQGIHSQPDIQYKDCGWISWGDFLGNNNVQSKKATFVSYIECKKWFLDNNIKSSEHWKKTRHIKPATIPSHPEYYTEWQGWEEFLKQE